MGDYSVASNYTFDPEPLEYDTDESSTDRRAYENIFMGSALDDVNPLKSPYLEDTDEEENVLPEEPIHHRSHESEDDSSADMMKPATSFDMEDGHHHDDVSLSTMGNDTVNAIRDPVPVVPLGLSKNSSKRSSDKHRTPPPKTKHLYQTIEPDEETQPESPPPDSYTPEEKLRVKKIKQDRRRREASAAQNKKNKKQQAREPKKSSKKTVASGGPSDYSNGSSRYNKKDFPTRFHRIWPIACLLGLMLLGAIGTLSYTLYKLRNDGSDNSSTTSTDRLQSSSGSGNNSGGFDEIPEFTITDAPTIGGGTDEDADSPTEEEGGNDVETPAPTVKETEVEVEETVAPTMSPTSSPSSSPTSAPVVTAPVAATPSPTLSPSSAPVTSLPSVSPSYSPSAFPTSGSVLELTDWLSEVSPMSIAALTDPSTAQFQAVEWLAGDPLWKNYTEPQLVQRWALATFYYSMEDVPTRLSRRWMDYQVDECNWLGLTCNDDGTLFSMDLTIADSTIEGTIPPEFALLSSGLEAIYLGGNDFTGSIPAELGMLTELRVFDIDGNEFDGSIPSELGMWSNLELFDVRMNNLNGTLPVELGEWTNLVSFDIVDNDFSGSIPAEYGNWTQLSLYLAWQNPRVLGPVPDEICAIPSTPRVTVDCDLIECACCSKKRCDN